MKFIKMTWYIVVFMLTISVLPSFMYKPVVLIHGIMTGSGSMEMIGHRIQEVTIDYNILFFVLVCSKIQTFRCFLCTVEV